MISVLRDPVYRILFGAQVVALTGTGLATVALGLLAYDLAGPDASAVLGTALAIKMLAYVGVAPIATALLGALPRRAVLVSLNLVRVATAALLPWVSEVWQVYVLIFLLQAGSAAFTPLLQATVPDVLPDERDYTRAVTLSRMAYDLESLLSPALAAAALAFVSFHQLFVGTALGFAASALLVLSVVLPRPKPLPRRHTWSNGIRIYLATPRLRGLLAVHFAAAAAGSMVFVNTVVQVRSVLGHGPEDVAVALAANGAGSLIAALALPRLLDQFADRVVVLRAAGTLVAVMFAGALFGGYWPILLLLWALIGAGCSLALTPGARLLRRSADPADRPALFAADFSLSHACWLFFYPLAGWLATVAGMTTAFVVLGTLTGVGAGIALRLWPTHDPEVVEHEHRDLAGAVWTHSHEFRINEEHARWPR
ncbi:MFS transporter [Lentzea sp. HUAS TT2]|uniref:MFS transporter n=1 Tax=Lentzea sp. HUAS TT2 TaxID=3447454 RepID=UPI003F71486A